MHLLEREHRIGGRTVVGVVDSRKCVVSEAVKAVLEPVDGRTARADRERTELDADRVPPVPGDVAGRRPKPNNRVIAVEPRRRERCPEASGWSHAHSQHAIALGQRHPSGNTRQHAPEQLEARAYPPRAAKERDDARTDPRGNRRRLDDIADGVDCLRDENTMSLDALREGKPSSRICGCVPNRRQAVARLHVDADLLASSFLRTSSLTTRASAWPFVAFITWPTKNPRRPVFPAR